MHVYTLTRRSDDGALVCTRGSAESAVIADRVVLDWAKSTFS